MTGALHLATRAGEPSCRSRERVPRLTSDVRIVGCDACRETRRFNEVLRSFLLKRLRAGRVEAANVH